MDFDQKTRYRYGSSSPATSKKLPRTTFAGSITQPAAPPLTNTPARPYAPPVGKESRSYKRPLLGLAGIVVIAGLGVGSYFYLNKPKPSQIATSNTSNSSVLGESTKSLVSIPVYYPVNLPAGYTLNKDAKVLKENVLFYSVTGPKKQSYYVTQQPLPANFDFVGFNSKFLKPDNFNTQAGTVTAGVVGSSMLGSLRTNKNTWVLVNSSDVSAGALPQLETLIRSLQPK